MGFMAFELFVKLSGTIVELFLPWMLARMLDVYVPLADVGRIVLWGVLMAASSGAALFLNVYANRLSTRIARDFTRALRRDLFGKILSLSAGQEDSFTTSSLISRITSDTYNTHQMVDRMQRLGVRAPILLIGGVIVTFLLEPVLTAVLVCILPLLAAVVLLVSKYGVRLYTVSQGLLDNLIRRAQESMGGIRVIQALSKTQYEKERFDEVNLASNRGERKAGLLMAVSNPVMNLLLNCGLALVIVVGAYRVHAGNTAPGVVIAFLSYFTIILNSIMMVTRLFVLYSKGAASAARIEEVLLSGNDLPVLETGTAEEGAPHIEFENVSFSYNKKQNDLEDISFSVERGGSLGIIGPTGSGKSTVMRLLLRLYDADAGTVRISGRDVRGIEPGILYGMFGVVFQNDFVFADTLRENIDFGRDLADGDIEAAVEAAQAQFIHSKEEGLDGALAIRGANLSGGQRQRLLISRALAGNPDILLLDDSSSALDYRTDAALRREIAKRFSGTTRIIIAQRVSSVRNCDNILVLEHGQAAGYGTHEQLMIECPYYREIAEIQMGEMS